jgi:hypothetical protein
MSNKSASSALHIKWFGAGGITYVHIRIHKYTYIYHVYV